MQVYPRYFKKDNSHLIRRNSFKQYCKPITFMKQKKRIIVIHYMVLLLLFWI